ncbi:translation initiation factor 1 [Cupriavidus campinensis]
MSVCEEWEIMHLTPEGWKDGSYRHEPGDAVAIAPPADDVLTVRRHVSAAYNGPSRVIEDRTPRTEDMALIEQLLSKFGAPGFGV